MSNRLTNPNIQFLDNQGEPLAAGLLWFYVTGTSTPTDTYSDDDLAPGHENTNPIVLDAAGRAGNIFLDPTVTYKVVLETVATPPSHGTVIWTADPVVDLAANINARVQIYAGNPNGNVAGSAGAIGGVGASMVYDITNDILYICTTTGSAATAAWTAVTALFTGDEDVRTNDHTVVAADNGRVQVANKATAITFPLTAVATLGSGFLLPVKNIGAGILTLDPDGAELIDGAASIQLAMNEGAILYCNGSTWRVLAAKYDLTGPINVVEWGADPTGVASSTTAFASAIAAAVAATPHKKVIFPAGTYTGVISIQDIDGLTLQGEGKATKVTSPNNATAIDIFSNVSSGTVKNITIRDMAFFTSGATGIGVRIWNCIGVTLSNVYASGGNPYTIQGTGVFLLENCQGFAGSNYALSIGNGVDTLTNSGPGAIVGGQYSNQSTTAFPVIKIYGETLAVVFNSVATTAPNFGAAAIGVIVIDGSAAPLGGIQDGSVEFIECYCESTYNTSNNGVQFLIGNTNKYGHVGVRGGTYAGHGNGTNYQQDWMRIVAARSVVVDGVLATKYAATNGYSRAMIRLESTFPAAGDAYRFSANNIHISGAMYSDANSVLTVGQDEWLDTANQTSRGAKPGFLFGLTLSNNAGDATNDIDIAAGSADDSTGVHIIALGSSITKRLDAAWAVGTNQGGLDTGAIANAWYYLWLIKRVDTGVVDVLFSISATAPTMPTNYTLQRRIGAIFRTGAAIKAFSQVGDRVMWKVPVQDYNNSSIGTSAVTVTMTAPVVEGIDVDFSAYFENDSPTEATQPFILITSPLQTDSTPSVSLFNLTIAGPTTNAPASVMSWFRIATNTGAIRLRCTTSAVDQTILINTFGYWDNRGQSF